MWGFDSIRTDQEAGANAPRWWFRMKRYVESPIIVGERIIKALVHMLAVLPISEQSKWWLDFLTMLIGATGGSIGHQGALAIAEKLREVAARQTLAEIGDDAATKH